MNLERLTERIKRHEGFVPRLYRDPLGVPTLGYGHNLYIPITRTAAEVILRDDLLRAISDYHLLPREVIANLSGEREEVLVEMIFNLGVKGVLEFRRMLEAIARGNYEVAAREMLDSRWARQVGRRARTLARIMIEGGE